MKNKANTITLTKEQFDFIESKINSLLVSVHEAQRELGLITAEKEESPRQNGI